MVCLCSSAPASVFVSYRLLVFVSSCECVCMCMRVDNLTEQLFSQTHSYARNRKLAFDQDTIPIDDYAMLFADANQQACGDDQLASAQLYVIPEELRCASKTRVRLVSGQQHRPILRQPNELLVIEQLAGHSTTAGRKSRSNADNNDDDLHELNFQTDV